MLIQIESASHTPIYAQIVEQVERLVAAGRLPPGERLPSVRRLAETLLVNPNTVARAYRTLEREGVVVGRKGDGVFVADRRSPFRAAERERLLTARIDDLLEAAAQLGVDDEAVVDLVRRRAVERTSQRKRG